MDDSAQPWVAYAIDTAKGQEIRVATVQGSKWTSQTAASIDGCSGCRQSGPAPIAVNADGPLVVYVDGAAGAVMAARQSGNTWTTETVQTGISPSGLSVAVDASGTPWVTYYTGGGAVNLATTSGAGWTTVKVADAKPGAGTGTLAETTGVAVDDKGTVYAAWYDDTKKVVHLASGAQGTSFAPIDTAGTEGGGFPSLAVTPDGSRVFLAWYDMRATSEGQNLMLGVLGDATDILVAEPSPTPGGTLADLSHAAGDVPEGRPHAHGAVRRGGEQLHGDDFVHRGEHGHHDLFRQPGHGRAAQRRRLRQGRWNVARRRGHHRGSRAGAPGRAGPAGGNVLLPVRRAPPDDEWDALHQVAMVVPGRVGIPP